MNTLSKVGGVLLLTGLNAALVVLLTFGLSYVAWPLALLSSLCIYYSFVAVPVGLVLSVLGFVFMLVKGY